MDLERITKLQYEIHSFSSFSSSYLPENIRDDNPSDQISRWSSDTNVPTQFITLRLNKPAIVKKILFGKHKTGHVCNLKKFKIYGGLQESNMFQIFEGGLKNDNVPEIFDLKHKMYTEEGEREIPILYVQIVPLLSFGPSFNFSIWYVELRGVENDSYVSDMMRNFNDQREKQAIRLVLKHLRDKGYMDAFKTLENEANIHLEDNQITELYQCLVEAGNFEKSEEIMAKFIEYGDVDEYISNQKYKAHFCEILSKDSEKVLRPKTRVDAGYAFDNESNVIYMFGGHCEDDSEDLNDFWLYDIKDNKWTCISESCSISPRSGQKMVFDPVSKQIFMLGRKASRGTENVNDSYKNDFYLYDIQTKTWMLICEDTKQMNGPSLIQNHQICLNPRERTIYVFGGKLVNKSDEGANDSYSGFYSYHINTNTWNLLCLDINHINAANPEINSIKARVSHSMLYDDNRKKIYMICGHRAKESFNDIVQFDIESNLFANTPTSSHVASSSTASLDTTMNCEKPCGSCFSTIDLNKGEIYILIKDNLWMYSLATNEYSTIHKSHQHSSANNNNGSQQSCKDSSENYSRAGDVNYFVHANDSLYVFKSDSEYIIQLRKPSRDSILNYCKYLIRRQQYEEITRKNPISALSFLRNDLSETIDKNDINQVNDFHKLASLLFCNKSFTNCSDGDSDEQQGESSNDHCKMRNQRSILFNKLTSLLPKAKCQPQQALLNFINV
ncbi:muskelin isoform X2 [Chironomus tepperi]|uniref:muskelin isoform X2 n=1 Tax=Chironomus tepperi TaxID=113505 RepID=UPI00391F26FD